MIPEFSEQKHGYDKQEVDLYIELIRSEYAKVHTSYTELIEKVQDLEVFQGNAKNVILSAQTAADNLRDEAEKKAEEIIASSQAKAEGITAEADSLRDNTKKEADQMISEGQSKAAQIVEQARIRSSQLIEKGSLIRKDLERINGELSALMGRINNMRYDSVGSYSKISDAEARDLSKAIADAEAPDNETQDDVVDGCIVEDDIVEDDMGEHCLTEDGVGEDGIVEDIPVSVGNKGADSFYSYFVN